MQKGRSLSLWLSWRMVPHNPLVSFEIQKKRMLSTKSSIALVVILWASLRDLVLVYKSLTSLRIRERTMVNTSRKYPPQFCQGENSSLKLISDWYSSNRKKSWLIYFYSQGDVRKGGSNDRMCEQCNIHVVYHRIDWVFTLKEFIT